MRKYHHVIVMHLTQVIVILYLKKNLKFWVWLLQCPTDGLLSSMKHSESPDILHQIYLEGFRTGKTSCQQGNIKYFSFARVILAAVHISIQVLFSLAPPSDSSGARRQIYTGRCAAHLGLESSHPSGNSIFKC